MNQILAPSRRGSAIVMVMVFCIILAGFGINMYKTSKIHRQFARDAYIKKQAEYIARAGLQHALLKYRLMPTELYDAAAFSSGKNPYFNFKDASNKPPADLLKIPLVLKNPGPMIIAAIDAGSCEKSDKGVPVLVDPAKRTAEMKTIPGGAKPAVLKAEDLKYPPDYTKEIENADLYLFKYRYDITSQKEIQPALAFDNANAVVNWKIGDPGEPFEASYKVVDLKLQALKGRKYYDTEAIEIIVDGTVKDPKTGMTFTKRIQEVVRVSRNKGS